MGAPWQGLLGAVCFIGLGCIVHVQCTCKWFAHSKIRTHLQVKREAPLIPNSQVTCILCLLKIQWGWPFLWGEGCTRQRRKTFLTWGPPVKVDFELATPNSVPGCTLARPTWRRMKKRAGLYCARAVHVQMFCTCSSFCRPLKARRYAPLMPNLQVTCMPPQPICICGYRSCPMQVARASKGKVYLTGVLRF